MRGFSLTRLVLMAAVVSLCSCRAGGAAADGQPPGRAGALSRLRENYQVMLDGAAESRGMSGREGFKAGFDLGYYADGACADGEGDYISGYAAGVEKRSQVLTGLSGSP
jgi:hypothetical protein